MRRNGNVLTAGPLTFRLAQEFGFCYGVDRAVDYAYETCAKFPDRRRFLVGEIIHNPFVNANLARMGITVPDPPARRRFRFLAARPRRRGDPPRVRRDDARFPATARHRLHRRRHHLRIGAQRLEAGRELCPGRLHRGDPRQTLSRRNESHRQPGGAVSVGPLPHRLRHDRGPDGLRLDRRTRRRGSAGGVLRAPLFAGLRFQARSRTGRRRQPDHDALGRVAGDCRRIPSRPRAPLGRRRGSPTISARSTPSARRPRSGRTPSSSCSRSRST